MATRFFFVTFRTKAEKRVDYEYYGKAFEAFKDKFSKLPHLSKLNKDSVVEQFYKPLLTRQVKGWEKRFSDVPCYFKPMAALNENTYPFVDALRQKKEILWNRIFLMVSITVYGVSIMLLPDVQKALDQAYGDTYIHALAFGTVATALFHYFRNVRERKVNLDDINDDRLLKALFSNVQDVTKLCAISSPDCKVREAELLAVAPIAYKIINEHKKPRRHFYLYTSAVLEVGENLKYSDDDKLFLSSLL